MALRKRPLISNRTLEMFETAFTTIFCKLCKNHNHRSGICNGPGRGTCSNPSKGGKNFLSRYRLAILDRSRWVQIETAVKLTLVYDKFRESYAYIMYISIKRPSGIPSGWIRNGILLRLLGNLYILSFVLLYCHELITMLIYFFGGFLYLNKAKAVLFTNLRKSIGMLNLRMRHEVGH